VTSRRRVLITGVTGQDGWYTATLLGALGDEVHGVVRPGSRSSVPPGVVVHEGDLADAAALADVLRGVAPDELYHLAAPTFVPASWEDPASVMAAVAGATGTLLAAAAALPSPPRVWVASSSEVFGDCGESPQHERTPMRPRSPYGVAKLAAHGLVRVMRERQGLWACSGLLFNHESPRRPERFLPRKVSRAAAAMAAGRASSVTLGSLDAVRDWSHAEDVARCSVLALRSAPEPSDYVVASGVGRTVRDLVRAAFAAAGLPADDDALDRRIEVDPAFVRPPEPWPLVGDPSHARDTLGWQPRWTFEAMIAEMVRADLSALDATPAAPAG
jgi:GDPmannose 4,6-dehydratase